MSRLAVPVSHLTLYATGDILLWVDVTLSVRDGAGNFVDFDFQVDSGTDITTFPASDAKQLGLYLQPQPVNVRHEQTGLEVRSGQIAFRIQGMDQTLYAVPCFFLGDPDTPPAPGTPRAILPRKLLQPLHLLDVLKFSTEKDPASIGAPHGEVIIEKK
ncbi:MAG TPA: hypothetical protein VKA46_06015 [Gemmataceae bacterium]|nr:hypothetical protein [Gemmataceae bacterium]